MTVELIGTGGCTGTLSGQLTIAVVEDVKILVLPDTLTDNQRGGFRRGICSAGCFSGGV